MATLNEINTLSQNSHLINRISAGLAKAAEDVRNEDPATANHTERFDWASGVLLVKDGPYNEAVRSIWLVLQNTIVVDGYNDSPVDGGPVTDNNVQFVVNGIINFLAGV